MKHRLLVLTSFPPSLDAPHAGRVIAALLLRIAERHEVALVCLKHDSDAPVDDVLRKRCHRVEEVPLAERYPSRWQQRAARLLKLFGGPPDRVSRTRSTVFANRLRGLAEAFKPSVIQVEFVEMAQHLASVTHVRAARVLVDHDPGYRAARDYSLSARGLRRLSRSLDAIAWKRFSRKAYSRVDRIVVLTDRDRRSVMPLAKGTKVETIPLAVELPRPGLDPLGAPSPVVLFFGDYLHTPNADAALRLISGIMPRVRAAHPAATLELVGAHPTEAMVSRAGSGVNVRGAVPSVTPYLERAAVVVAPLRFGGGMRIKVLETLAAGKALIASPRALEGLDVRADREVLVAETDEEFSTMILALLDDGERRLALARGARAWAETNLGWDPVVAAYEALYEELLSADN